MAALNHSSLIPDAFALNQKAFNCKIPRCTKDVKNAANSGRGTNLNGELEKFNERRLIRARLLASLPHLFLHDSWLR